MANVFYHLNKLYLKNLIKNIIEKIQVKIIIYK